jgi:hypothetical protein
MSKVETGGFDSDDGCARRGGWLGGGSGNLRREMFLVRWVARTPRLEER